MKRNTLYTINKWNRPAFISDRNKNIFAMAGQMNSNQQEFTPFYNFGNLRGYNQSFNTGFGVNSSLNSNSNSGLANPTITKGTSFATTNDTNRFFNTNGLSDSAMQGLQKWNQQIAVQNAYNFGKTGNSTGATGAESSGFGNGQAAGNAAWSQAIPGALNGWTVALQEKPEYSADAHNGFSLVDSTLTQGKRSQVGMGLVNSGASVMNKGLESGNGIMALVGGIAGTLGTIINNGWGYKVNEQRLADVKEGIARNRNFFSNASDLDDIKGPASTSTNTDIYEGGVFTSGKARAKNRKLAEQLEDATLWANRTVENNAKWLIDDIDNRALRNYASYGGPLGNFGSGALGIMQNDKYLDAINYRTDAIANKGTVNNNIGAFTGTAKTFADGGLAASFMDSFAEDPIGAAVRYNQGIERMEAEKEAAEAQAAQAAEYAAMQQRLAKLETQNQGLQAIMAATQTPATPEIAAVPTEAVPEVSSTPSKAVRARRSGNRNWDYIEEQLKKSGKFNDIQIEGIKYNLQRESGIGMYDGGDNGTAHGLAQWRGARVPEDMSLEGQTQYLIDTLSNYDGKLHWIGRGNYEGFMNARTPEEAHYYIARGYERPHKDIVAKVKRDSDMSLSRLKAFGGELGTNGTDFTNGLLWISEGGTHEDNPIDGVPMGLDAEGIPNLVEEGETVYNDYVFSDRMMVPDFMYKELGLGGIIKKKGRKGMSFADASKKLAQESEQRPNDPISQAGLSASLSKLAEVQETERMRKQMEEYVGLDEYACGGKMEHRFDLGGLAWIKKNHPEIKSPEAVAKALENMMQSNRGNFYRNGKWDFDVAWGNMTHPKMFTSDEDVFNQWVKHGLDRKTAFDLSHAMPKEPKNSDLRLEYQRKVEARNKEFERLVTNAEKPRSVKYKDNAGNLHATREEAIAADDAARKQKIAAQQTPVFQNPDTYTPSPTQLMSTKGKYADEVERRRAAYQEAAKKSQAQVDATVQLSNTPSQTTSTQAPAGTKVQGSQGGSGNASKIGNVNSNRDYGLLEAIKFDPHEDEVREALGFGQQQPVIDEATRQRIAMDGYQPEVRPEDAAAIDILSGGNGSGTYTPKKYDTWMRYAPAVGAGLMTMTDLLGLTNKPDYTYADKLEAAANAAAYAPHIEAEPIGNYLRYNPMDIWYKQNELNAQSRATDRAILNSGTNQGSKEAALLASGYNSQLASGNLYRQALEYNDAQRQAVENFNRGTNMFNSQMGLEADMANARYRQQAQQLGLSGLAQAAALRDSIDQRVGAAKAANLSNFLTSLGNIGRENFAMNQINWDRSRRYYGSLDGTSGYKSSGKYGGKIRKRK